MKPHSEHLVAKIVFSAGRAAPQTAQSGEVVLIRGAALRHFYQLSLVGYPIEYFCGLQTTGLRSECSLARATLKS